jgi:GTP-binding protein HflX
LRFPHEQDVIVTDTVGFIHNLPKTLMTAFKATLEELQDADVLLQVLDIADENYERHLKVVNEVLLELELHEKKKLLIFNKIDLLNPEELAERIAGYGAILISAEKKEGFGVFIDACVNALYSVNNLSIEKAAKISQNILDAEVCFDERPKT